MASHSILVLPVPSLYGQMFTPESNRALCKLGDVTFNQEEHNFSSGELAGRISGFDIVVTGWGTPVFTDEVLAAADRLRLIAHTAGSIKRMLPRPVFERGIRVTHAASAIAPAVADLSLLLTMLMLRQAHRFNQVLKEGDWEKTLFMGQEITGQRVDGEAPPLHTHVPCCYPTRFQATGLVFPTEGCWAVTAKATDSELSFVVRVDP